MSKRNPRAHGSRRKPEGPPARPDGGRLAEPSATLADFPIVGVGASAGGLEAFSQLLAHLPSDTGMAFVLVQHLDPTHPSMLTPALARATKMVVTEALSGTRVKPDHVYVIPPNADLAIGDRVLTLSARRGGPRPHMSIDFFFRTLAEEEGSRAIGVLLSGTGSDGTEGLHAIKAEGGITFAQAPRSARFGGMPEHAALSAGFQMHLAKPMTLDTVCAAITELAGRPAAKDAARD